jgi:hypothetical protein
MLPYTDIPPIPLYIHIFFLNTAAFLIGNPLLLLRVVGYSNYVHYIRDFFFRKMNDKLDNFIIAF